MSISLAVSVRNCFKRQYISNVRIVSARSVLKSTFELITKNAALFAKEISPLKEIFEMTTSLKLSSD